MKLECVERAERLQRKAIDKLKVGYKVFEGVEEKHLSWFKSLFPVLYSDVLMAADFLLENQLDGARSIEEVLESDTTKRLMKRVRENFSFPRSQEMKRFLDEDMLVGHRVLEKIMQFTVYVDRAMNLDYCKRELQVRSLYKSQVKSRNYVFYMYEGRVVLLDSTTGVVYSQGRKLSGVVLLQRDVRTGDIFCKQAKSDEYVRLTDMGFPVGRWKPYTRTQGDSVKEYIAFSLSTTKDDSYGKSFTLRAHQLMLLHLLGPEIMVPCKSENGILAIDHVNMNSTCNRPENLRILSSADNLDLGKKVKKGDFSTVYMDLGVLFGKDTGYWRYEYKDLVKKFDL